MPKSYPALSTFSLKANVGYFHPTELPEIIHWDDPALQAMVDFKYIKAETISAHDPIDTALMAIKNCQYHTLLVIDHDRKVVGIVSAEDLLGEKPLKVIQEKRLPRAEISVGMVMIPQADLIAIDQENLRHAKVGHIVETLHANKQHFILIIKSDEKNNHSVRGLFSISQISKQLGQDVTKDLSEARSIAELQHDLHLND